MRRIVLAAVVALSGACGDDVQVFDDARPTDAVAGDASDGGVASDASCFMNPTTHVEIINACTTAEKIYKNPVLPLQLPDGGLPPLP